MLITMTVGGGFTGVALTLQMLLSPRGADGFTLTVMCISLLLHLFVLTSGLLILQNPHRVMPLVIAMALQIPVISSPIISYRFGDGLFGGVGLTVVGFGTIAPFGWIRLGSDWQLSLLRPSPWGFGINLVPVLILAALSYSRMPQRRPAR